MKNGDLFNIYECIVDDYLDGKTPISIGININNQELFNKMINNFLILKLWRRLQGEFIHIE